MKNGFTPTQEERNTSTYLVNHLKMREPIPRELEKSIFNDTPKKQSLLEW
jgi:hypothetical protein